MVSGPLILCSESLEVRWALFLRLVGSMCQVTVLLNPRHRRCRRLANDFLHVAVSHEGPARGMMRKSLEPATIQHPSYHDLQRPLNAYLGRTLDQDGLKRDRFV